MPTFKVKANGQEYLVKAATAEEAASAFTESPPDRSPNAPAGTFVDPQTGQPSPAGTPTAPEGGNWLAGAGRRLAEPVIEAAQGAGDLVGSFGRKDAQINYKDQVDTRNAAYYKDHPEDSPGVNQALAGAIPVTGAAGEASAATGFFRALARRMLTGATVGASQYTPQGGSKGQQMVVGAGLAGAAHTVTGVLPAAANVVRRALVTGPEASNSTRAVVEAGRGFLPGTKALDSSTPELTPTDYTIAQASAKPSVARLSQMAYNEEQQNHARLQVNQTATAFDELAGNIARAARTTSDSPTVATSINKAINTHLTTLRAQNSSLFRQGLADVRTEAGPTGGAPIALTNLKAKYASLAADDANPANFYGSVLPKSIQTMMDALKNVKAIRPVMLQKLMAGLGQGAEHGGSQIGWSTEQRAAERARAGLFAALNEDIDSAGVSASTDPAFAQLRAVRDEYARRSAQVQHIEDSAVTRLFGDPRTLQEPQALLNKFYAMHPDDQKASIDILRRVAPDALGGMRSNLIRSALDSARTAGAAKDGMFDIAAFNRTLFAEGRDRSPLWQSDKFGDQVRQGAAHLKVLLNAVPAGGGSPLSPADVAINTVSMNLGFIARQLTRVLTGSEGDKLLGTPEGLKALRTLSNVSSRKSAAGAAALTWLTNLGQQPDPSAPAQ